MYDSDDGYDYIRVNVGVDQSADTPMTAMFCTRCGRDAYLVLTGNPLEALEQMEQFMEAHKDCCRTMPENTTQGERQ